ncbi:MAG TPA: LptF/LptG family permease [Fimbriimonadaceae bacterium]|nr:LptF/LptG family permease [Fimbriimonadaceae bacterium]
MKKLDVLIIKEIFGPWLFGVALFGSLLFAATYLGRVAEYAAKGIPADMIGGFAILLLPAILVQTFAMSCLLAALLAFGRLSSDSEIVAVRAAGVSLFRIIAPVSFFALAVAILAFATNETVVPAAAKQAAQLLDTIARRMDKSSYKDTSYPILDKGQLKAMLVAKDFSPSEGVLRGATVIGFKEDGTPNAYLYADRVQIDPKQIQSGTGWKISGQAVVTKADGSEVIRLDNGAWPPDVPTLNMSIGDLLSKNLKSFETLSMRELKEVIDKNERAATIPGAQSLTPKELRNYQYGYWSKIALPLAALIFGTLGAALGIRNHRTGTAAGFALAVAIIFGYFTIANFMNVWALNGNIAPYIAAFSPIAVGLIASVIIIWRRNA